MSAGATIRIAIPARYDSTRLPGKPLVRIHGRPLLEHVWRCACAVGADEVVVATDDERVVEAATAFGAKVCLTGSDHTSGTERLAEVAREQAWAAHDIVVNLQGDEPLTPPAVLRQVARNLEAHPDAAIATLATPMGRGEDPANANLVKVVTDGHGRALYFSRAPIPCDRDTSRPPGDYWRHIGLYAYRCEFLQQYARLAPVEIEQRESLEQLRALWHGFRIHVDVACEVPGAGVDTPEDLERVAPLLGGRDG